jgi:hypothetical protein
MLDHLKTSQTISNPPDLHLSAADSGLSNQIAQSFSDGEPPLEPLTSNEIKQQLLCTSGKPLVADAVARKLDISVEQVDERRQKHELIAAPSQEYGYLYPAFQFQPDGSVLKYLDKLLYSLRDFDPWMQLVFLQTGDIRLDGATPLEMLQQGEISQVLFAAHNYGTMQAA